MNRIIDQWNKEALSLYIVKEPSVGLRLNSTNGEEIKECIKGYLRGTYSPDLSSMEKAIMYALAEDLPKKFECHTGPKSRSQDTARALSTSVNGSLGGTIWTDFWLNAPDYDGLSDKEIEQWIDSLFADGVYDFNLDLAKERVVISKDKKSFWGLKKKPGESYTLYGKYQTTPSFQMDVSLCIHSLESQLEQCHNQSALRRIREKVFVSYDEKCRFMLAYFSGAKPLEDFAKPEYRVNNNEVIKVTIKKQDEGGVRVERVTQEKWKREKENGIVLKALPV